MNESKFTPNQLAFLALSNEYCHAVETAAEAEREEFIDTLLRLLPRIYISATDLAQPMVELETSYIPASLDEEYYDAVRRSMELQLGEDDTYLDVFEEDMKFSDTPIAASLSEGLADIFQVLYNLTEYVKESSVEVALEALDAVKEDFEAYWSKPLCNALRALNAIKYK